METLWSDVRGAIRLYRSHTWTLAAAVVMLAVGIGGATAMFSIVRAVLLRPLPMEDLARLVILWERDQNQPVLEVSYANFTDWRAQNSSFTNLTAVGSVNWDYIWHDQTGASHVTYAPVSTSFFDVVGVGAAMGRTFVEEEDASDASRVVVLSHGFWQRRFGGTPDAIGRTMTLEGAAPPEAFTVIGVMPSEFDFPRGAELWTPVGRELAAQAQPDTAPASDRGFGVLYVLGRLKPEIELTEAHAEIDSIVQQIQTSHSQDLARRRVVTTPLLDFVFGEFRLAIVILSGAVGLVLILACANVGSLMMLLGLVRQKEMALRLALGAARSRVMRQMLAESVLLSAVACLCGTALAWWAVRGVVAWNPVDVPGLGTARVDLRVLTFAGIVGAVTAVAVSLLPAWQATAQPVVGVLKETGISTTAGRRLVSIRGIIVGVQLAVATVVLIGASLMVRSFLNVSHLDLGFNPTNVLALNVTLPDSAYPTIERKRAYFDELLSHIASVPGVASVGAIYQRPLAHGPIGMDAGIIIEGQPLENASFSKNPLVNWQSVTPGYFATMGLPVVHGRNFSNLDTPHAPPVVIVSETLARRMWPNDDAVGKRLLTYGAGRDAQGRPRMQTVVGIAKEARYRELELSRLDVYVPYLQAPIPVKDVVVRTTTDPLPLLATIRRHIRARDPHVLVERAESMENVVSRSVAPWRFNMIMFTLFGALALLLTVGGLFSLMAHSVSQRTREVGVRMALGAGPRDVLRLFLRQALLIAGVGMGVGLVAAYGVGQVLSRLLFGVSGADVVSFVAVTVLLLVVALIASYLPARRAAAVEPALTLKSE